MAPDRQRVETILRAIVHEIRTERVTFLAGSIAYNAFLSLLPLLFLLLAIVSSLGAEGLDETLIGLTETVVTEGAGDVLVAELRQTSVGVSAIGIAILVWGALRIFRSLDMAFSDIYESQAENTLTDQIIDGLVVLASLALVVALVVIVEAQVDAPAGGPLWLLERVLVFVLIAAALFPMFYRFPDEEEMQLVEAVPGTVVTAFGFMALQSLFGIYLAFSSTNVQNSVLASLLVFLTWLYFLALVMLIGAAINAVLSNRSSQVQLRPVVGDYMPASSSPDDDGRLTRVSPATLEALVTDLTTARELTIVVDGAETALPPPERVDANIEASPVPFLNNTAHIELHWVPADE